MIGSPGWLDGRRTRSKEDSRNIGTVHTGPVLEIARLNIKQVLLHLGCRFCLCGHGAAADASIVDQDAQALLAALELPDQLGDVVLLRYVEATQGNDFALDVLAVSLDDLVQLLLRTARDVDLGAVDSQSLCDHQADA